MGESRSEHSPKYQMKHRLTGAAVIIVAALSAILLLLREPARIPGNEVAAQEVTAPEPAVADEPAFQSNLVPLNVSSVNLNEKGADSADVGTQLLLKETEPGAQQPEQEEKADREQANEPSQDGTSGGWSVRVGTFTKAENVERMLTLLGEHGFDAKRTRVQIASGEATRVWLGPYAKRETADTVNARLHALRGEKGYVIRHEP